MRFLILVAVIVTVGCSDEPSPAEGTWFLTMTPVVKPDDCVTRQIVANASLQASFVIKEVDGYLVVDSGPSEPGVTEIYDIRETGDGAVITVDSYEDGLEGHVTLRATGQTVTGEATLQLYVERCEQAYTATGRISRN